MSPGADTGFRFDSLISPNGSIATLKKIAETCGRGSECESIDDGWPSFESTDGEITRLIEGNRGAGEKPTLYFSILFYNAERTLSFIRSLRDRYADSVRIVASGQLVQMAHEPFMRNSDIDIVAKGDAEVLLPRIMEHISNERDSELARLQEGEVQGGLYAGASYDRYFGIRERLAMQEHEAGMRQVCMQGAGGPGCAWAAGNVGGACNFCALTNITRMNRTPLREIVANEAEIVAQTGATRIFDVGNQFLPTLNLESNKQWLREYIRLRAERGLASQRYIYLTVNSVDEEIATLLKELGVVEAYIGIDHFHKEALREQNKGSYRETEARLFPPLDALLKSGINVRAGVVLGAVRETAETLEAVRTGVRLLLERYAGNEAAGYGVLKTLGVFPIELLPGSKLWESFVAEVRGDVEENNARDIVEKFYRTGSLSRAEQVALTKEYVRRHSDISFEKISALEDELAVSLKAAGVYEHTVTAKDAQKDGKGEQLSELRRLQELKGRGDRLV